MRETWYVGRVLIATSRRLTWCMLRQDMYAKGKEPLQKLLHVAPLTVSQIKHQYAFEVRRRVWCRVVRRWMGLNPLCPCVLHQVAVPGKKYFFRAPDAKQQKMWVDVLGAVLEKVREDRLQAQQDAESSDCDDVESAESSSDDE